MKLVYILLAAAVLKCIWLYKVYGSIPPLELKRRAQAKDRRAAKLYKVSAYGSALDVLLWTAGTAAAALLVIWSARTVWWLAAIVVVITAWLVFAARLSAEGPPGRLAAAFAPYHARFLGLVQPLAAPLAKRLAPAARRPAHTGLFEKGDLLEF